MTSANVLPLLRNIDTSGQPAQVQTPNHRLIVCEAQDPQRPELERFIHDIFANRHGAVVKSFAPTLLGLHDGKRIVAAVGFRAAAREPLFLERYLDDPIEQALSKAWSHAVTREQVVEVGNLAGINCRAATRLVLALPQLLLSNGYRWITFTATETVRELLDAYQTPLTELAPAVALRVSGLGDDWGRYYDTDPRVMAGYLPDGLRMRRRTPSRP